MWKQAPAYVTISAFVGCVAFAVAAAGCARTRVSVPDGGVGSDSGAAEVLQSGPKADAGAVGSDPGTLAQPDAPPSTIADATDAPATGPGDARPTPDEPAPSDGPDAQAGDSEPDGFGAEPGSFVATGNMIQARYGHTATLLPDGKVLIVGGIHNVSLGAGFLPGKAELYDPASGVFSDGSAIVATDHTATLLPNGQVLIIRGDGAALYDPIGGTVVTARETTQDRAGHTATLLLNGRVLVAGGGYASLAEVYDPADGTFTASNSMTAPRSYHTATLLPDGKVLVVAGTDGDSFLASAEMYDPVNGTFTARGNLAAPRLGHTATLLQNGKVLIAGGHDLGGTWILAAELYDPPAGAFATTGSMTTARFCHTATILPNGKVLIAGGGPASAELYDPVSETFTTTGSMTTPRSYHTATLLPDGQVLVTGGQSTVSPPFRGIIGFLQDVASAELYSY